MELSHRVFAEQRDDGKIGFVIELTASVRAHAICNILIVMSR